MARSGTLVDRHAGPRWPTAARLALGLASACLLCGCTRPVSWEEDVLLNTGETIQVRRSASYSFGSWPGNPLQFGYGLDLRNTIEFRFRGKRYAYESDGKLQLIAISPEGLPNLVISARDEHWQWQHDYHCVRPSYVQLRPDTTGRTWAWPARIEPWLHGLPTNLLMHFPEAPFTLRTINTAEKAQRNATIFVAGEDVRKIVTDYQTEGCKHRS